MKPARETSHENRWNLLKKSKCFTPEKERILWQSEALLLP